MVEIREDLCLHPTQVIAEAIKVLRVIEKEKSDVTFNIKEHLLGGV